MKPILKQLPKKDNEQMFNQIRNGMVNYFEKARKSQEDEDIFFDVFNLVIKKAQDGNLPAQDYLGYVFKKGLGELIPENYELSMKWQLLSGANGNDFSIRKLKIFFSRSYDDILSDKELSDKILKNYEKNPEFEIGKLFCEAIVDELKIDVANLAKEKIDFVPSTVVLAQKYEVARQNSLSHVVEYLKKL